MESPSQTARNGKDTRFKPGNKAAKGNATARKVAQFRAAMFRSVSVKDLKAVVEQLLEKAKRGEQWAVIKFLEYAIGKPAETLDVTLIADTGPVLSDCIQDLLTDRASVVKELALDAHYLGEEAAVEP